MIECSGSSPASEPVLALFTFHRLGPRDGGHLATGVAPGVAESTRATTLPGMEEERLNESEAASLLTRLRMSRVASGLSLEDAQDLLQEVVMRLLEIYRTGAVRTRGDRRRLAFGIARRCRKEFLRKQNARRSQSFDDQVMSAQDLTGNGQLEHAVRARIREWLAVHLAPRDVDLLLLVRVDRFMWREGPLSWASSPIKISAQRGSGSRDSCPFRGCFGHVFVLSLSLSLAYGSRKVIHEDALVSAFLRVRRRFLPGPRR